MARSRTSFPKGMSGNPGGRPKTNQSFAAMCREGSLEYFVSLDKIARDFSHKHQVKAIELLLAYGHGRPAQTMSMRKITSITDLTDEELDLLTNDPEGAG